MLSSLDRDLKECSSGSRGGDLSEHRAAEEVEPRVRERNWVLMTSFESWTLKLHKPINPLFSPSSFIEI